MSKPKKSLSDKEASQAAKALELLLAAKYVSKKRLYLANFLRGIFFSLGAGIGAAIILGIGAWILSWFDSLPLIGPLVDSLRGTIESTN